MTVEMQRLASLITCYVIVTGSFIITKLLDRILIVMIQQQI